MNFGENRFFFKREEKDIKKDIGGAAAQGLTKSEIHLVTHPNFIGESRLQLLLCCGYYRYKEKYQIPFGGGAPSCYPSRIFHNVHPSQCSAGRRLSRSKSTLYIYSISALEKGGDGGGRRNAQGYHPDLFVTALNSLNRDCTQG